MKEIAGIGCFFSLQGKYNPYKRCLNDSRTLEGGFRHLFFSLLHTFDTE